MRTKLVFEWKKNDCTSSARDASHIGIHTFTNKLTHIQCSYVCIGLNANGKINAKNTCRTLHPTEKNNAKRHGSTDGPNRTDRRWRKNVKISIRQSASSHVNFYLFYFTSPLRSMVVVVVVGAVAHYIMLCRCVSYTIDCAGNEMENCEHGNRDTQFELVTRFFLLCFRCYCG